MPAFFRPLKNATVIDILAESPRFVAATISRGAEAVAGNPYSGFNICPYTCDDTSHINQCRLALADELGISPEQIVMPRQTHSPNVKIIDGPAEIDTLLHIDALVTSCRNIAIGINTADCVPVLLIDETAGAIAAVHSGWRGTVANIVSNTIDSMQALGALPQRIRAFIGPCIHQCCFETGRDVTDLFPAEFVFENKSAKPHVDLPGAVVRQLADAGVCRTNIAESPCCSRCNPMKYCSARASGVDSARTFSFILLKN